MRRLVLLLAVLALPAAAQTGRFDRINSRTGAGRSARGFAGDDAPFFEFAPANGAGMTAECACTTPTGASGQAITYSRGSVGYCTKADYTLVQCSTNQARIMPGRPGAPLGLLVEQDATNLVLQNSDLSQAVWTKSANMSCVLNATGPDGVASSASTCTTSAATQTVTQATVRASAANGSSYYLKRVTGSGVVEVLDTSGAYQAVTASLTTSWKRAVCKDTEGCMGGRCIVVPSLCATSTNPSLGIRIQTSGDAVAVALVQSESGLRPSSPIATGAASANRSMDSAYWDAPAAFTPVSMRLGVAGSTHLVNEYGVMVSNGAAAPFVTLYAAAPPATDVNNVGCLASTGPSASAVVPTPAGGVVQYSCEFNASGGNRGCVDGRCEASGTGAAPSATRVYIGGAWTGSADKFQGVLSSVCVDIGSKCIDTDVWPRGPSTGHIVWLGDSITNATTTSNPTYPTIELYRLHGQYFSRQVANWGWLGYGLTNGSLDHWRTIKTKGFGSLVVLLGVNDLRIGTSAATIWALYQPMLDEAKALGWNVTPVKVLCWGAWAEWTAGKQTETDTLNASLQTWCNANGETCVDVSSMCTGNNLSAGYSFGDGLHLNGAGATQLATLVAAALP